MTAGTGDVEEARGIRVRAATTADEPAWRELWAAYLAFYGEDLADEVTAGTWRRVRDGVDGYQLLLAVTEVPPGGGTRERVVGFVHSVPRVNTWSRSPDVYLEDLFVVPDVRGGGVGRALIAAVAERARELEARKVTWETDAGNATAQRLYDRLATRSTEVHYALCLGGRPFGAPTTG